MRCDGLQPFVGTGGSGQKNRRQPHAGHLRQVLVRLFNDQISHQHAIHAEGGSFIGKFAQAVAQNRIQVAEDHQPRRGPLGANLPGQLEHVPEPRSTGQRTLHGALNHRAIGQRVAEGYTQLDHIRARVDGRNRNGARGFKAWVARRQINHQSGFVIESYRHRNLRCLCSD